MKSPVAASGLRTEAREELKRIDSVDILIGIPSFNNEQTIQYVVESVAKGVNLHFPDKKALVMVSDGGSLDDTRERALDAVTPPGVEQIVTIYRGIAGKGSAFRTIFEAASYLNARQCLVVDSDLRSNLTDWVRRHLEPLMEHDMDLLTPNYARHKHDGTITNNVCFPVTAALYGVQVRQPIGGDFALSGRLARHYARQNVWDTDVARFGIDIWMSTEAICEDFRVGQTNLGAKIHDPKDPGESLAPMFRQVVGTLFYLMGMNVDHWLNVSEVHEAPVFGDPLADGAEEVPVNRMGLRERAQDGWRYYRDLYEKYLGPETLKRVSKRFEADSAEDPEVEIPPDLWANVLYDYAIAYNRRETGSEEVLDSLVPLYFGRTATLFDEMDGKDAVEAEDYIVGLVDVFRREKSYLVRRWEEEEL